MNKKNNQQKHIKRKARLKLVFEIFPEINSVYKEVLNIFKEAEKLEKQNALVQTHKYFSASFQALMNFTYLDSQEKNIDLEKYDKEIVKNFLYQAGCSAYSVIILHYYNKKTDVLDKYFIDNIEQTIPDYYKLYKSPEETDIDSCSNKIALNKKKEECNKAKNAYKEVCEREKSFQKAYKSTRRKNIQKRVVLYTPIVAVVIAALTYFYPLSADKTEQQDYNNTSSQQNNKDTSISKKELQEIIFFSISKKFNTNITINNLEDKQLILNTTLHKLSSNESYSKNKISLKLESSCLICIGNIYTSINFNQKKIIINTSKKYIKKGIYFIYSNEKLEQITYEKYKNYMNNSISSLPKALSSS